MTKGKEPLLQTVSKWNHSDRFSLLQIFRIHHLGFFMFQTAQSGLLLHPNETFCCYQVFLIVSKVAFSHQNASKKFLSSFYIDFSHKLWISYDFFSHFHCFFAKYGVYRVFSRPNDSQSAHKHMNRRWNSVHSMNKCNTNVLEERFWPNHAVSSQNDVKLLCLGNTRKMDLAGVETEIFQWRKYAWEPWMSRSRHTLERCLWLEAAN